MNPHYFTICYISEVSSIERRATDCISTLHDHHRVLTALCRLLWSQVSEHDGRLATSSQRPSIAQSYMTTSVAECVLLIRRLLTDGIIST